MTTGTERAKKPWKGILLWLLGAALLVGACIGFGSVTGEQEQLFPVYITEILAANTAWPNEDGRCCDYIEIYNRADYPVDLTGFQLGDPVGGNRYAFPAGTVMEPGSYLVIYCDKTAEGPFYAPFEISRAGGESFSLVADNKAMVDTVTTLAADTDQAMVLGEDGLWALSLLVSPGKPNGTVSPEGQDIYNSTLSPVRIWEVCTTNTVRKDGILCDWIELHNTSDVPVDISGFSLSDNIGNEKYIFPENTRIPGGGYLTVLCSAELTGAAPFGLSKDREESVVLKNSGGLVIEILRTLPTEEGSMALDEAGAWSVTQLPTPGFENTQAGRQAYLESVGAVPGCVRIAEAMYTEQTYLTDSHGDFCDWLELYNPGSAPLELTGWFLSDDPEEPTKWTFPELILEPGERRVIFCGGQPGPELKTDFALSAGETLTLYTYTEDPVDTVTLPSCSSEHSVVFEDTPRQTDLPTPGFANDMLGYEAFCATQVPAGPLAIWELMASNDHYIPQQLGECYDWVELRNISQVPVKLSGCTLTDDPDGPRHSLPDVTLQPGDDLVVILTDTPNAARPGYGQAPFNLNAQGDRLLLYGSDGSLLDYVYFRDIPQGQSYGRLPDACGFFLMDPTPGQDNGYGVRFQSAAPTGTYAPGVYTGDSFTVTLESPGTVYYTTDGSVPTTGSAVYTAPLQISSSQVIRAIALESGKLISDVYTATFLVGANHDLPVVSLVTDPQGLWGANGVYRNGDLTVKEIRLPANVAYSGSDGSFSIDCETNLHGKTTVLSARKKSFAVHFPDRISGALRYDVFEDGNVTAFRSLILRAAQEGSVSSHMHDTLMAHLAYSDGETVLSQNYKYIAMYLNGQYWGLYAIREQHSQEHYASHAGVTPDSVSIMRYTNEAENSLSALYEFCGTHSMADPENFAYAKSVLDMESYVDWVIYQAYVCNVDIYSNIRYYHSTADGLWHVALADLDLGLCGSTRSFDEVYQAFHHGKFFRAFCASPEFRDLLATRLAQMLEGHLSDENMCRTVNAIADSFRSEMPAECARWGYDQAAWENEIRYILRFCSGRENRMIDSLCAVLNLTAQEREHYFGHLA